MFAVTVRTMFSTTNPSSNSTKWTTNDGLCQTINLGDSNYQSSFTPVNNLYISTACTDTWTYGPVAIGLHKLSRTCGSAAAVTYTVRVWGTTSFGGSTPSSWTETRDDDPTQTRTYAYGCAPVQMDMRHFGTQVSTKLGPLAECITFTADRLTLTAPYSVWFNSSLLSTGSNQMCTATMNQTVLPMGYVLTCAGTNNTWMGNFFPGRNAYDLPTPSVRSVVRTFDFLFPGLVSCGVVC